MKNWISRTESQFRRMGLDPVNVHLSNFKLLSANVRSFFEADAQNYFSTEINRVNAKRGNGLNKLRTYKKFKQRFETEPYVKLVDVRSHRRALAQFRCGVAPIRLETGRYERGRHLPVAERTCYVCKDAVESEVHVILHCPLYSDLREDFFFKVSPFCDFVLDDDDAKLKFIFSCPDVARMSARFLSDVLRRRRIFVYTSIE